MEQLPESQGQNLALDVLYVPYSLGSGCTGYEVPCSARREGRCHGVGGWRKPARMGGTCRRGSPATALPGHSAHFANLRPKRVKRPSEVYVYICVCVCVCLTLASNAQQCRSNRLSSNRASRSLCPLCEPATEGQPLYIMCSGSEAGSCVRLTYSCINPHDRKPRWPSPARMGGTCRRGSPATALPGHSVHFANLRPKRVKRKGVKRKRATRPSAITSLRGRSARFANLRPTV